MKRHHKTIVFHVVGLLLIITVLSFSNITISWQDERIPTFSEMTEEFFDEFVSDVVNSDKPYMNPRIVLFGSEDIARKYARILYLENFGEWDYEFELWVKHYKKHGVWLAMLRLDAPYLDGPPFIIFRDTDGQIIWFGR